VEPPVGIEPTTFSLRVLLTIVRVCSLWFALPYLQGDWPSANDRERRRTATDTATPRGWSGGLPTPLLPLLAVARTRAIWPVGPHGTRGVEEAYEVQPEVSSYGLAMINLPQAFDLPAWIEASATAVTAVIALYLLAREQADRRERARDRRAAQARGVRMDKVRLYYHGQAKDEPASIWDIGLATTIHNDSTEVMTVISATFVVTEKALYDHPNRRRSETGIRVNERIDPGESESIHAQLRLRTDATEMQTFESWLEMTSSILFEDAAGRYWQRDRDHRLHRVHVSRLRRLILTARSWIIEPQ
jgi:hypothetical protein